MSKVVKLDRREIAGCVTETPLPWSTCGDCGEATCSHDDLAAVDRAMARALVERGEPSGEAADFLRKELGHGPGWRGFAKETLKAWRSGATVDTETWAVLCAEVRALPL